MIFNDPFAFTVELLDSEMLFDPLKKQFDCPVQLIQLYNFFGLKSNRFVLNVVHYLRYKKRQKAIYCLKAFCLLITTLAAEVKEIIESAKKGVLSSGGVLN